MFSIPIRMVAFSDMIRRNATQIPITDTSIVTVTTALKGKKGHVFVHKFLCNTS